MTEEGWCWIFMRTFSNRTSSVEMIGRNIQHLRMLHAADNLEDDEHARHSSQTRCVSPVFLGGRTFTTRAEGVLPSPAASTNIKSQDLTSR